MRRWQPTKKRLVRSCYCGQCRSCKLAVEYRKAALDFFYLDRRDGEPLVTKDETIKTSR